MKSLFLLLKTEQKYQQRQTQSDTITKFNICIFFIPQVGKNSHIFPFFLFWQTSLISYLFLGQFEYVRRLLKQTQKILSICRWTVYVRNIFNQNVVLLYFTYFYSGIDRSQSQFDSYLRNCESHSQAGSTTLAK